MRYLTLLFALLVSSAHADTTVVRQAPVIAPAWDLKTPAGDTVHFPADAHGQPTVLMFWPSWCPFSRALQPYVQDIWTDYRDHGVNVWTINIKETGDPVQTLEDRGLTFPLLLHGDPLVDTYVITRTPWLVVVDGGNHIVYTRPPNPPTPIDTAIEVRKTLNGLIGDRAVPIPASFPKPYDLHLKKAGDLGKRLAPKPVPQSVWAPWLEQFLAGVPADEAVADIPPRGPVPDGKTAIAQAKELWTKAFGAELVETEAPYRTYRKGNRWVVLATGTEDRLGDGLVLVIDADTGRVVRIAPKAS